MRILSSTPPVCIHRNFDYSQFENPELQSKAKTTFNQFRNFVRQTFDGSIENGKLISLLVNTIFLLASFGKILVYF